LRGSGPYMQISTVSVGYGGRYAATSILILVSAILVFASQAHTSRWRWRWPWPSRAGPAGARSAAARSAGARSAAARSPGYRPTGSAGARSVAFVVCCALLLPAWVVDFRDWNGRAQGPSWQSQLSLAVGICRTQTRSHSVSIAIDPPGWAVVVPCRDVTGHHGTRAASASERATVEPVGKGL